MLPIKDGTVGTIREFSQRAVCDQDWDRFATNLFYVCQSAGSEVLAKVVGELDELGGDVARHET